MWGVAQNDCLLAAQYKQGPQLNICIDPCAMVERPSTLLPPDAFKYLRGRWGKMPGNPNSAKRFLQCALR